MRTALASLLALLLGLGASAPARAEQDAAVQSSVDQLIAGLKDKSPKVRQQSAQKLSDLKEAAAPAVPELIRLLSDPARDVRLEAVGTLGYVGPKAAPAVPQLIKKLLEKKDERMRRYAAAALGKIGPAAKDALPALLETAQDEDVEDSQLTNEALLAIGLLGPDAAPDALPVLIEIVKNEPFAGPRASAAEALGLFGAAAREALPALQAMAQDQSLQPGYREAAEKAIHKIEGQ